MSPLHFMHSAKKVKKPSAVSIFLTSWSAWFSVSGLSPFRSQDAERVYGGREAVFGPEHRADFVRTQMQLPEGLQRRLFRSRVERKFHGTKGGQVQNDLGLWTRQFFR